MQPYRFILPAVRSVILAIAIALFLALCFLPLAYMLAISLIGADGSLSVINYSRLLMEPRQRNLLLTSMLLGTGTSLLASIVGVPLGLLFARADIPAKRICRLLLIIPLIVPPYILALAWIYLGGSAGIVAQIAGRDIFSEWTYSLAGAVIVLGLSYYPLIMLATEAAARSVDGRLEESALMAAPPRRVIWKITLPLIAPGIAAATLVVFVLAISEFSVPALLRVRVYTTEVFTAFSAFYDFGAAVSLTIPLIIVTLLAGIMMKAIIGERLIVTRQSVHRGVRLLPGLWRAPVFIAIALVLIFSVALPVAVLVVEAGSAKRIASTISDSTQSIAGSLILTFLAATLAVALATLLGYWRARTDGRWQGIADLSFITLFAVPGTVIGVGLIGLWNRSGWPETIYSSPLIIVIAYLARFVPVAAMIIATSVRQVPVSFEEAAEIGGASWPRIITRIVLPQILNGIGVAWIVVFIFAFGEIAATVLVAPPGESTLPIRIYTIIANTSSSRVAALALMQAGIALAPLALLGAFAYRKGGRR
jgi:iron(III) transport system permease protein